MNSQITHAASASPAELEAILEGVGEAFLAFDNNWNFTYLNSKARELTERLRPGVDLLGKNAWQEFPEARSTLAFTELQRVMQTRNAAHFSEHFARLAAWLEVHAYPGMDGGVSLHAVDITSRKRAEEALRRSEERYREIFEYDMTGNFMAQPDGTLLDCNPAFQQAFGFAAREEALGKNLAQFWPADKPFAELVEVLRINRTLQSHESELRDANDQPLHVIANYVGSFDEAGNLMEIKGFVFNDTQRRFLEEQLRQAQKMDAIGRLAGGVAHDFNNLLTVITGHSELLIERLGPHDISRRSAEQIQKAARRAAGLTHQLLAFSRKQILAPQVLDLNVVVDHVSKMLRRVLGEDVELRMRLGRELGHIKADPVQIEQMVMNLAINARDAMPGGGRVTIETSNVELDEEYARHHMDVKPGPYVMLAVSDTGEGMSPETQARIFEPFFTTKDVGKGTGLGLSTVYGIVRQSSGSIWVYSEPGHGSTFKVYLPQVADEEEVAVIGAEKILAMPSDGWETVLLVEDEEGVRLLGKKLLEMLGYYVLEASDGGQALEVAREYDRDIHLLLTDVVMPGMSGRELARRMVKMRPKTRVLYMSGYTGDTVVRHGIRSGESMFLQKPFNKEALAAKVREALDVETVKVRRRSARA